jgi:hypothetical protein
MSRRSVHTRVIGVCTHALHTRYSVHTRYTNVYPHTTGVYTGIVNVYIRAIRAVEALDIRAIGVCIHALLEFLDPRYRSVIGGCPHAL